MTDENRWKLVVDGHGITIASDRFQFTTNGSRGPQPAFGADVDLLESADSGEIESLISALQSRTRRSYGQFCGLSRAFEVVGERWAMHIIRDLLVSPKSATDLQRGLPRIPADVLTTRLDELERAGVIRRSTSPLLDDAGVYELTEWGNELEEIILRLSRWGARLLGEPGPEDIVTPDSLIMSLRSAFQPAAAAGMHVTYELRVPGIVIHARVDDGAIMAGEGEMPGADLVMETARGLKPLMTGEMTAAEAIESGMITITGDAQLLARFAEMFHLPPSAMRRN